MKTIFTISALLLATSVQADTSAPPITIAQGLQAACSVPDVTARNSLDSPCMLFIAAFQSYQNAEAELAVKHKDDSWHSDYCITSNAAFESASDTFLYWMKEHPEAKDWISGSALLAAFTEAYPCPNLDELP